MKFSAVVVATVTVANAAAQKCSLETSWAEGMQQTFFNGDWPTGPVGSIQELIIDAADASASGIPVEDGKSGDTDFPHGNFKTLATVGEYSICEDSIGEMIVGVPDGLGAYLYDDTTVRVIVQSESYGPLRYESYPFFVNDGAASFTGSHLQYVDYEREDLASYMESDLPASSFVKGMGEVIKTSYNLKGELVGPRAKDGPTTVGAHYSNTDVEGNYIVDRGLPGRADWLMQSLCSAHLEEKHQWGDGIGLEDDVYFTNEEWMTYIENTTNLVGIAPHAVDLENHVDYALGVLTQGGFEKIVEINSMHPDYIVLAISGYNGPWGGVDRDTIVANRNALYSRMDGEPYVWTNNVHPARIYVGKKGFKEDGTPATDFLSRNGLRYGQLYGFAIDMSESGPTAGMWRDEAHRAVGNGYEVPGVFAPIDWKWTGEVVDWIHDGSWEFQNLPLNVEDGYEFWNAAGPNEGGCKTEHLSSDPRLGRSAFVQTSTCGYFGHYYLNSLAEVFMSTDGDFPETLDATYFVYEGERSIFDQIELGGKGQLANGQDARYNCDSSSYDSSTGLCSKTTFEDIDGFEIVEGVNGKIYAVIQEDSGNRFGDRMFVSSALEHLDDGKNLTYYFSAMSGGSLNSRAAAGIPAGTSNGGSSHEFSGVFDMSGLLAMQTEEVDPSEIPAHRNVRQLHGKYYKVTFMIDAADTGVAKRMADRSVDINDKSLIIVVQAHDLSEGVIKDLQLDRGGQWFMYRPKLPYQ